jgi:hypothetical protein
MHTLNQDLKTKVCWLKSTEVGLMYLHSDGRVEIALAIRQLQFCDLNFFAESIDIREDSGNTSLAISYNQCSSGPLGSQDHVQCQMT